jgi:hypothetical protein
MGAPDVVYRGLTDALLLCQCPATPVRHTRRCGLQGCIHDGGNFIHRVGRLSTAAWSYIPQTFQSRFGETLPPEDYRVPVYRKPPGDRGIGFTFRGTNYNSTAQRHPLRSAWAASHSSIFCRSTAEILTGTAMTQGKYQPARYV